MNDIPYALRSEFLEPCEQSVAKNHKELDSGLRIDVALKPGGYNGHVIVTIPPGVTTTFQAERKTKDITRFPSRIKAAATALRNCDITGSFDISHVIGRLSIMRINESAVIMLPRYLVQRSEFRQGTAIMPFTYLMTHDIEEARQEANRHTQTYILDRETGGIVS